MDRAQVPWWSRRSSARDTVYAILITAITVFGSYGEAHPRQISDQLPAHSVAAHMPTAALLLVVVACLALAVRNRWPLGVLAVSVAAVTVYAALGYVAGAAQIAPVIAVYTVATKTTAHRAIGWAVLATAALMTATGLHNPFGPTGGGFYLIPGMIAVACLAGIAVASRRAYVVSIEARAEQDAQRRIDEERLRIARDLHDVVAHTMATINVQAGTAAHVAAERPEVAVEALQTIKAASKDGLRELRAILNVLRRADEADPIQPTPGIAQVGVLAERARQAGVATTVSVAGEQRPLCAAVELAAYRIVQESLTNTIRHAGPATAAVSLSYLDGELRVEVTDTGGGKPAGAGPVAGAVPAAAAGNAQDGNVPDLVPGTGHGLAGMRERAASVGGTVEAGPQADGGFRVAARLPAPAPSAAGVTRATATPVAATETGVAGKAHEADETTAADEAEANGETDRTEDANGTGEAGADSEAGVGSRGGRAEGVSGGDGAGAGAGSKAGVGSRGGRAEGVSGGDGAGAGSETGRAEGVGSAAGVGRGAVVPGRPIGSDAS